MSLFAPPDVIKMEGHRDVEGLIKALNYRKDKDIRRVAASALAEIGGERAVEPLIQALRDEDEFVRTAIVDALGLIGDSQAVEPLISHLLDEDHYVRRYSAEALENLYWAPDTVEDRVL